MRKQLTTEQKEKQIARRAAFAKLAGTIAAMTPEARAELSARMPVATVEGRALSVFNACLLVSQCPTVSIVGGFQQWLKAGRCVRKGEHGLMIWCPASRKEESTGQPGEVFFIPGTVFDVTQTDAIEQEVAA